MKARNLKISTRLITGLSIFLFIILFLAGFAYWQIEKVWQFTHTLYQHPLHVARATRDIKSDVLLMNQEVLEFEKARTPMDRQVYIESYQGLAYKVEQSFSLIHERFLGPTSHIEIAHKAFRKWDEANRNNFLMVLAGHDLDTIQRTKPVLEDQRLSLLFRQTDAMIQFAKSKADSLYQSANQSKDDLTRRLWWVLSFILAISFSIIFLLITGLVRPLKEITKVTLEHIQGNHKARSNYSSTNEIGILASSINRMAEHVEQDLDQKGRMNRLASDMAGGNDPGSFFETLMQSLVENVPASMAAVYIGNEKGELLLNASFGLETNHRERMDLCKPGGEFDLSSRTGKIEIFGDFPPDESFWFPTAMGKIRPKSSLAIPIHEEGNLRAMIWLASLEGFPKNGIGALTASHEMIKSRVLAALAFQKTTEFSRRLDIQNQELTQQTRELTSQAAILEEYNQELEHQKNQLNQANQLKSVFLSSMSHELRTPLNSIIALSGLLSRRMSGQITTDEAGYLDIIERNGKHLLSLINDILDLSRIEAGKEFVQTEEFDLHSVLNQIIETQLPLLKDKPVRLECETVPGRWMMNGDRKKCHHILQNLIGNAVKFTERGKVSIEVEIQGSEILVRVSDTGIGIPPNQLPHIFDEFRQGDGSTSRKYGGTGLGLAIARRYAEMLHGRIEVDSEPAQGSQFRLWLPVNLANQKPNPFPTSHFPDKPFTTSGKNQTILLVEDSEAAIIQIRDILEHEGLRVLVAKNGVEALNICNREHPDAMILDLMMPELDGFQVLETIRNMDNFCRLPVLILSAKQISREELSFLKENNVYQLVQKGDIGKNDLIGLVFSMLSGKSRMKKGKLVIALAGLTKQDQERIVGLVESEFDCIPLIQVLESRKKPDLILSGLDDSEAIIALLEEAGKQFPKTPILGILESPGERLESSLRSIGISEFIIIPEPPEDLNTVILNLLKQKS